ncbi:leucine-rich repeat-containing protein (LRR) [Tieghemostelium lacteum]|uniref:Leucine-rich repeat-containing protein (LRR) n=1 Tax=Tieghemostelium lacteum TaxID=361077 RepID=A0A152A1W9_TIELA|nr:leucine-rich repeat-containing protein (LRR) [Tieghemostelium lacteum]|eukprot:KYR00238.1 leucine-rich repeat-containing protein (LRR) [Tieghemostelium lacteum]
MTLPSYIITDILRILNNIAKYYEVRQYCNFITDISLVCSEWYKKIIPKIKEYHLSTESRDILNGFKSFQRKDGFRISGSLVGGPSNIDLYSYLEVLILTNNEHIIWWLNYDQSPKEKLLQTFPNLHKVIVDSYSSNVSLYHLKNITHLRLNLTRIADISNIVQLIQITPQLKTFNLVSSGFHDITKIAQVVLAKGSIRKIDFINGRLKQSTLVNGLNSNTALKSLNVGCALENENEVDEIPISNQSLRTLTMEGYNNYFSIFSLWNRPSGLQEWKFHEAFEATPQLILDYHPNLTCIECAQETTEIDKILEMNLPKLKSLRYIDLYNMHIPNYSLVIKGLRTNQYITTVSFNSRVEHKDACKIIDINHPTLESLSFIQITAMVFQQITESLKSNTTLKEFRIDQNSDFQNSQMYIPLLCDLISSNHRLSSIHTKQYCIIRYQITNQDIELFRNVINDNFHHLTSLTVGVSQLDSIIQQYLIRMYN